VVPPSLDQLKQKDPSVYDGNGVQSQPHSLQVQEAHLASDTLSPDNGGDSGISYLGKPPVRRYNSQAHSPPAQASGSHHSPTLWAPPQRLLLLFIVFLRVFDYGL